MKVKNNFTVVDIIGIVLIFITLVILVIPFIVRTVNSYKYDASIIKIETLLNSALEEYKSDTDSGKTITAYCYRSDYGYAKTLNSGTIKSISNLKDNISYYITFDENGDIISFIYADDKYGINLEENVTESIIKSLNSDDFITAQNTFKLISKCPYNSD